MKAWEVVARRIDDGRAFPVAVRFSGLRGGGTCANPRAARTDAQIGLSLRLPFSRYEVWEGAIRAKQAAFVVLTSPTEAGAADTLRR